MSKTSVRTPPARVLPDRPNLEHLKNEAKQRLAAMRAAAPDARLSEAQFELAREYGFSSWRELKTRVEPSASDRRSRAIGDWIGALTPHVRLALHVRPADDGTLRATLDSTDYGAFDILIDEFAADDETMSFALLHPAANATYEARWNDQARHWSGPWLQNGMPVPLTLSSGLYPPQPTIEGLDGIWDGALETAGGARLVLHVWSGPHGTLATVDSPDRGGVRFPAKAVSREGRNVVVTMRTATIVGQLSEDGAQIDGHFTKERTHPLVLRRRPRGAPPPRGPHPPSVELAPEILVRYVGEYGCGPGLTAEVAMDYGGLLVRFADQPQLKVLAASPTEFFWRDLDLSATFEVDPAGDPTGFVLHQRNGRDSRYKRLS